MIKCKFRLSCLNMYDKDNLQTNMDCIIYKCQLYSKVPGSNQMLLIDGFCLYTRTRCHSNCLVRKFYEIVKTIIFAEMTSDTI